MKAAIVRDFMPFDQITVEDIPEPVPSEGEAVVAVEASEVNFPDILLIEGRYQRKPQLPFTLGFGCVGRVIALGPMADGMVTRGDRVLVLPDYGTHAERVVVPASLCMPVPDEVPSEIATALGLVYQTAYFSLRIRAKVKPGDTVLVLGASGGVGMAAIQLARAFGAGKIIATSRGEDGVAFARSLGSDVVIDAKMADLRNGLPAAVKGATNGRGADIVVDPVGGTLAAAAIRAVAWNGSYVVVGFASGEIPSFNAGYLLVKNISVSGLQWTDYRSREPGVAFAAQHEIFDLWSKGMLSPHIDRTLPLAEIAEALRAIGSGKTRGKVILEIGRPEK
ncbi:NADPH:quinone oxidoreductase family protein [Chelativorans alearense]|uniref:NADPH:quinone oxidoreductase family protein n=1 Tax=Chelativorans alearense TaxID=2681495 RepID=UPI0013D7AFCE|nr:NADPH:quinone oxidoreductase family protein [Chelativorans alearense]